MISIIIPAYNAEKTLDKCLLSIIELNNQDWEVLLIDDGSTDNTLSICNKYAKSDSRIHVYSKENGGVSSARNIGLKYAKGEWITFCDADDWVNENWLELFQNSIDTNSELIVQGFTTTNGSWPKGKTGIKFKGKIEDGILLLAQNGILGYLWTKILRRDIIKRHNIQFDERFRFREDEDLILRYMQNINNMTCIEMSGYNYNVPDFTSKYSAVESFYSFLSIYSSLNKIYVNDDNWLIDDYRQEVTQSLFESFAQKDKDSKNKILRYKEEIGSQIFKTRGVSLVSKIIITVLPPKMVFAMLKLKDMLHTALKYKQQ